MSSRSPDPIGLDLIDRYFAGDCTPDEVSTVERWVAAREENAKFFDSLRMEFGGQRAEPPQSDVNTVWTQVAGKVAQLDASANTTPIRVLHDQTAFVAKGNRWITPRFLTRVAAGILVLFGSAYVAQRVSRQFKKADNATLAARVYTTAPGQRAELRLTDGTRVTLAAASRIEVPANYDSLSRAITLDGEAYFDVVHNVNKPFIIKAHHALVQDVGTRFDVRAYHDDAAVRVVVTDGIVDLRTAHTNRQPATRLVRGELGRIDFDGRTSVTAGVDTARLLAWTSGRLLFTRTPVHEALAELSRWYDIDFTVADSVIAGRTLTATLQDQPLSEVLQLLSLSLDARVQHSGRLVTLSARSPHGTH